MDSRLTDPFTYRRRPTSEVNVAGVGIGGDNPVRIQSMANTSTMDTDASVCQCLSIAEAGAELVRFTAQGVREAENLGKIRAKVRECGCTVPLVADIHFNPRAAFASVGRVDKIRINPGNFIDPGRTFVKLEFTDAEYESELERLDAALTPLLESCRKQGVALRIGVNHGSLSDRIMSRYGDTPEGMTESAMEFLRVCRKRGFDDVVISIKASNVCVMVRTVRMLVRAMSDEGMHYPLHLGVTEAGDAEDGRIKSAVGIGSLLASGIGDTIRVSLCEPPENEVPVARMITDYVGTFASSGVIGGECAPEFDELNPVRRKSDEVSGIGDMKPTVVVTKEPVADAAPDICLADVSADVVEVDARQPLDEWPAIPQGAIVVMSTDAPNYPGHMKAALNGMMARGMNNPVILKAAYSGLTPEEVTVRASIDLGSLLLDGFADGIMIEADSMSAKQTVDLAFGILQAARLRFTRTEYIACPGCGRTMFDLQDTLRRVKEKTSALKGLKIGVMGCIVNGPGEMADADYGYVGAAAGRVSLYRGRECVLKNIPSAEAVDRLLELIANDGRN
ncbi:MAG: (E)-4-hydroxy-3-methylbut-2-enyl-diphosphate synthase [Muribaculaceae bacterium]|nr:(E)-4-hydroxy-3-methylbut-2-enyl-diphosphate synthase [Muribaculaceae bacterium]